MSHSSYSTTTVFSFYMDHTLIFTCNAFTLGSMGCTLFTGLFDLIAPLGRAVQPYTPMHQYETYVASYLESLAHAALGSLACSFRVSFPSSLYSQTSYSSDEKFARLTSLLIGLVAQLVISGFCTALFDVALPAADGSSLQSTTTCSPMLRPIVKATGLSVAPYNTSSHCGT